MNDLFLGIIALATLTLAVIQVGAIVYAARLARRVEGLLTRMERDVLPLITRASEISAEAGRAVSLALAQLERIDKMTSDVGVRVDQALTQLQQAMSAPARQGAALLAGLRAGFEAIRHMRRRHGRPGSDAIDDEDALFIG